jgi:hypothetical protein
MSNLPIIHKTYDLLEDLITARYTKNKLPQLENLNTGLEILRHQNVKNSHLQTLIKPHSAPTKPTALAPP